jgi:hypothetical protein
VSRTALRHTQPPIQWVPGALSLGVKRPGREADHSSPSSAEIKNAWSYISTPQYVFMAWCLVKHRDNFTFTFTQTLTHVLSLGTAFLENKIKVTAYSSEVKNAWSCAYTPQYFFIACCLIK